MKFPIAWLAMSTAGAAKNPNIVFILADDLGYNELNFMNATRGILTPNLDSLANAGVIMKNYYVQPICSPTRSALMTGRYTTRLGTQGSVIFWDTPWGIPLNETFIPQNLKDAGYDTAMFGKWCVNKILCATAMTNTLLTRRLVCVWLHVQASGHAQAGLHPYEARVRSAYGLLPGKCLVLARRMDVEVHRDEQRHRMFVQGCESAFTHVAACCSAGSPDNDTDFVCKPGKWGTEDYRGYDWFKTDVKVTNSISQLTD